MPDNKRPQNTQRQVLVVDDNIQLLSVVRLHLVSKGYHVRACHTGDEALHLLQHGLHPDILVTDAVMPGDCQGIDLVRFVNRSNPRMPVIMMSGYVDPTELPASDRSAIDKFIPKPFLLRELSEQITGLLKQSNGNTLRRGSKLEKLRMDHHLTDLV